MNGWETVLAAIGGTMLGFGLGLVVSARRESSLRRHVTKLHAQVRDVVLPVLERQVDDSGLRFSERPKTKDAIQRAVALAEALLKQSEREALGFSETIDIASDELVTHKERT